MTYSSLRFGQILELSDDCGLGEGIFEAAVAVGGACYVGGRKRNEGGRDAI